MQTHKSLLKILATVLCTGLLSTTSPAIWANDDDDKPSATERLTQRLQVHRADVNAADGTGNTPLHYACENHDVARVLLLLEQRANPHLRNAQGELPSARAVYPGAGYNWEIRALIAAAITEQEEQAEARATSTQGHWSAGYY
ncbi:MAG TPA: ankyrin repeat domain-containing protein [Opitutales bacterium]|nr:ankyrin repeat domain-containing protein [Opitutales bacterium]